MKDYDNSYLTEIQSEEATVFWMVDVDVNGSLHLRDTSLDIPLFHEGNEFRSGQFKIPSVNIVVGLGGDKVTVEYANVEMEMTATLLNYPIDERPVTIYQGAMDGYTPRIETFFAGIVSDWRFDDKTAEIEVSDEFVFWSKRSMRGSGPLCEWVFKDTETCRYSGSVTGPCNKTREYCDALGNGINHSQNSWISAVEEKEIWWGRKPK